jgi:predicted NBD/HSP70 family sugar kinase
MGANRNRGQVTRGARQEPPYVLLSSGDVGTQNRARIFQALADHGPLSRADLARMAGVPRATIGTIVSGLLTSGLLEERAARRTVAAVGQPPRPLWFGPRLGVRGAVLVQPGVMRVAVVDVQGTVLAEDETVFPPAAPRGELGQRLLAGAARVLGPLAGQLTGTGIAVPALCDSDRAEVLACTPLPGLVGTSLPRDLEQQTGAPVVLEEDVRALALGQRWFGRARGVGDFAALQLGEGIGAAIMTGGRLRRGELAISEVGHTCVDLHGAACPCGLTGCWETIASLGWLRDEAGRMAIPGAAGSTPGTLAARRADGDQAADRLLGVYADHIAVGIANLVHVLSLSLFILDGDVTGGGAPLRDEIQAAVRRRTLPQISGRPQVEFSGLGQRAGLLGAAAAVLTRQLGILV